MYVVSIALPALTETPVATVPTVAVGRSTMGKGQSAIISSGSLAPESNAVPVSRGTGTPVSRGLAVIRLARAARRMAEGSMFESRLEC